MTEYPALRPCTRCLRVTRPSKHKPAMYPFKTVVRVSTDLCGRCSDEINETAPQSPRIAQAAQGLNSYLAGRRQRLARTGRLTMS